MKGHIKIGLMLLAVIELIYVQPFARVHAAGDINTTKDYIFYSEYEDDTKISLDYNIKKDESNEITTKDNTVKLESFITYTDDDLTVVGTEAISYSDLMSGQANLSIDYRLKEVAYKPSTYKQKDRSKKNNLLFQDNAYSEEEVITELGGISFDLVEDNLYWRISNQNGSFGVGVPNIGVPKKINQLLPEVLDNLQGYNTITFNDNGSITGKLVIKHKETNFNMEVIHLSDLVLLQETNRILMDNDVKTSKLEIVANYNFIIPLSATSFSKVQNNRNHDKCITGTITLRFLMDVIQE